MPWFKQVSRTWVWCFWWAPAKNFILTEDFLIIYIAPGLSSARFGWPCTSIWSGMVLLTTLHAFHFPILLLVDRKSFSAITSGWQSIIIFIGVIFHSILAIYLYYICLLLCHNHHTYITIVRFKFELYAQPASVASGLGSRSELPPYILRVGVYCFRSF